MLFAIAVSVSSSGKFWALAALIMQKKSLRKQLNRIDPTIDPCWTAEIISRNSLLILLIHKRIVSSLGGKNICNKNDFHLNHMYKFCK